MEQEQNPFADSTDEFVTDAEIEAREREPKIPRGRGKGR
jgi:hypothetical protein